ncbi:MAG TPA: ATP-dependent DNA ligase [Casimicrobiaceae bacterium]|nr:ATP-dependent DNA ligase [Casimicrobiaceae bacterium]
MTLFAEIAGTSRRVSQTRSRNAKVTGLAACLRKLEPAEIAIGAAYLAGETRQGRSGIGHALIRDAQSDAVSEAPSLTILDVDAALARIAATSGGGSKVERTALLSALLARATADERDFLLRLLVGELRQGALESLVTDAVAEAASLPAAMVRQAAMVADGIASVAHAALTGGASGLAQYALLPMQPVAPMLAQPADDIADALRAFGTAAFEWKLDGARVQVHKRHDDVRIFTRNRNDVTGSAPEIVASLRAVPGQELILDGEAIALRANGAPQPFQVTMRRFGRTLDVPAMQASLPLSVFFSDCLRADGEAIVAAPASERFEALSRALPSGLIMPRIVTSDVVAAEAFYDDALRRGHEGVMAKSLSAPYEAGRRSPSWLKIKRLHTLDLVVLAAEWGHGRRKGWLSNLHLAARDDAGEFVMLGKTFKGMTDDMLAWQTQAMLALETRHDAWAVYLRPELVVEVAFNDLQASPRYPGGLALRFARVKRYRSDKRAEDADTMETVRAIYDGQLARGDAGT